MSTNEMSGNSEIPNMRVIPHYDSIPIEEDQSPLLSLGDLVNIIQCNNIILQATYFNEGLENTTPEIYLREEAAFRLIQAAQSLPTGLKMVIHDGYRSPETQQSLYNREWIRVRKQNPTLPDDEIHRLTYKYVSRPTSPLTLPTPHMSGGAVDLAIIRDDGELLDMGSRYGDLSSSSHTNYFMEEGADNPLAAVYHSNRLILYRAMTAAGFTNYQREWWHYDFGNQSWALLNNLDHARYSFPNLIQGILNSSH